jgi:hypothetical protein
MRRSTSFSALPLALALCASVFAQGVSAPARLTTLTPLDHVEIRQLAARYAHAVDQGADEGRAYADLFAPGATFGKTTGRDELAKLAKQTSRGPQTAWHFIVNHVIEPTRDGAKGREYMMHLRYGEPGQPNAVWGGGHYEDTYVKTPEGWRFASRQFIPSDGTPASLAPHSAAHH